jgi:hypothetical protein
MNNNKLLPSLGEEREMVYCTKCGTLNRDDAIVCTNCGTTLQSTQTTSPNYYRNWRWENWEGEYRYHRRSGAFVILAVGVMIILFGFSAFINQVYGINIPWWPIILVFVGIIVIISGLRSRSRWRRHQ